MEESTDHNASSQAIQSLTTATIQFIFLLIPSVWFSLDCITLRLRLRARRKLPFRFAWVSSQVQDSIDFPSLSSVIGLENSRHILNQSDFKVRPIIIATWSLSYFHDSVDLLCLLWLVSGSSLSLIGFFHDSQSKALQLSDRWFCNDCVSAQSLGSHYALTILALRQIRGASFLRN